MIYRYAERSGDRLRSLVFLVLGFVAVTLLVAGSGYITAPGWPIARTHVPILLIGWAATVAGLLTHVAVGTAKRARSQDGLPPAIVVGDFMLMVDAKLGHFLLRLVLGEMSVLLTEGRYSQPKRLIELGFQFQFEKLNHAMTDLLT